jgi:hypothetical protein
LASPRVTGDRVGIESGVVAVMITGCDAVPRAIGGLGDGAPHAAMSPARSVINSSSVVRVRPCRLVRMLIGRGDRRAVAADIVTTPPS